MTTKNGGGMDEQDRWASNAGVVYVYALWTGKVWRPYWSTARSMRAAAYKASLKHLHLDKRGGYRTGRDRHLGLFKLDATGTLRAGKPCGTFGPLDSDEDFHEIDR